MDSLDEEEKYFQFTFSNGVIINLEIDLIKKYGGYLECCMNTAFSQKSNKLEDIDPDIFMIIVDIMKSGNVKESKLMEKYIKNIEDPLARTIIFKIYNNSNYLCLNTITSEIEITFPWAKNINFPDLGIYYVNEKGEKMFFTYDGQFHYEREFYSAICSYRYEIINENKIQIYIYNNNSKNKITSHFMRYTPDGKNYYYFYIDKESKKTTQYFESDILRTKKRKIS